MKLAEALGERSDCQKRLEEIRDRLERSARIQEGEQPAEHPSELVSENDRPFVQVLELISRDDDCSWRNSARVVPTYNPKQEYIISSSGGFKWQPPSVTQKLAILLSH